MSKIKPAEKSVVPAIPAAKPALKPKSTANPADPLRTVRETIESIVIAFVLAFLFRTFEAEAFVIPTGSMAPTLQGRHKDVVCPKCGYEYRASASSEAEEDSSGMGRPNDPATQRSKDVVAVTCPLCRYTMSVDPQTEEGKENPSYNGDRIIVAKFPYEFVEPKRWDIVVFKYPGDAKTNYIKRLVGLPDETVHIEHGDIYTYPDGQADKLEIQRKSPEKQRAMAQIVYDNDYVVDDMTQKGWPLRWQNVPPAAGKQAAWTTTDGGRSFEAKPGETGEHWLRYEHIVPSAADWRVMREGSLPRSYEPKPQLITDFYAYNNGQVFARRERPDPQGLGLHWVGDLMCDVKVEITDAAAHPDGKLLLDLVEGGVHFRATIAVATGEATLSIDGQPDFKPKAMTSVKGDGTYKLSFSNFDRQLTLWVGGSPVTFDQPTTYGLLDNAIPKSTAEDLGDLAPVGIAAAGGIGVKAGGLRVWRDIYYIADKTGHYGEWPLTDYAYPTSRIPTYNRERLAEFMSTPSQWQGSGGHSPFDDRQSVEFRMEPDQFFVLGDNSPASKDSRLWGSEHYVDRSLMIGKALFIYWPHSFDKLPGSDIPFPFFPNFGDMGFVR